MKEFELWYKGSRLATKNTGIIPASIQLVSLVISRIGLYFISDSSSTILTKYRLQKLYERNFDVRPIEIK